MQITKQKPINHLAIGLDDLRGAIRRYRRIVRLPGAHPQDAELLRKAERAHIELTGEPCQDLGPSDARHAAKWRAS